MFCPKCGKQILDQSFFCMYCGANIAILTPINQNNQLDFEFQNHRKAVRDSEINLLNNLLQYFSQKKEIYDEYDNASELLIYYSNGAKSSLLVWGCILVAFGIFGFFSVNDIHEYMKYALPFILFPGILMLIGGILMKVSNRMNYNHFKRNKENLFQELYSYYNTFSDCPIGFKFSNPRILESIMQIIKSGRADTIKESINIMINNKELAQIIDYLDNIDTNVSNIYYS